MFVLHGLTKFFNNLKFENHRTSDVVRELVIGGMSAFISQKKSTSQIILTLLVLLYYHYLETGGSVPGNENHKLERRLKKSQLVAI